MQWRQIQQYRAPATDQLLALRSGEDGAIYGTGFQSTHDIGRISDFRDADLVLDRVEAERLQRDDGVNPHCGACNTGTEPFTPQLIGRIDSGPDNKTIRESGGIKRRNKSEIGPGAGPHQGCRRPNVPDWVGRREFRDSRSAHRNDLYVQS
jgi:hypothetical protein